MSCPISFSKFSDVLPTFTCARAIVILWSFCLGVNNLSRGRSKDEGCPLPCVDFIGNILLLKTLRINSRPS